MNKLKPLVWEEGESVVTSAPDPILVSINELVEFAILIYNGDPDISDDIFKLEITFGGGHWDCFHYPTIEQCQERANAWWKEKIEDCFTSCEFIEVPLTRGKVAIIDKEDYVKVFSIGKWHYHRGYAINRQVVNGKRKTIYMHRLVMNAKEGEIIDHSDGNGLNNRKLNLRLCNHAENMRNRKLSKNNKSGFKGVVFKGSSWIAQMRHNKETIYLGSYANPIEAAKAYNKAAIERQGKFAKLNQIPA